MKRLLIFFLIVLVFVFSLTAAHSQGTLSETDDDNYLELEFTNGITANIGFTREPVSGSIKPSDDGFSDHNDKGGPYIVFSPSADSGTYTTGTFNIYAQVFVPRPVELSVQGTKLSNGSVSVDYVNTAIETSSVFHGSETSGEFIIVSEDLLPEELGKPRVYNRAMCLVVDDIDSIISSSASFEGTLTIKLEAK